MKKILLLAVATLTAFSLNAQNIVKGSIEGVPAQGSYHPTYSSDGAQYLPKNVILMIGDGTGLAQLTYHAADDLSPVWSKDGRYIYFISQRGDQNATANVWRISFNY